MTPKILIAGAAIAALTAVSAHAASSSVTSWFADMVRVSRDAETSVARIIHNRSRDRVLARAGLSHYKKRSAMIDSRSDSRMSE